MMKSKSRAGAEGRMETFNQCRNSNPESVWQHVELNRNVLDKPKNFPLPAKFLSSQWKIFMKNRHVLGKGSVA